MRPPRREYTAAQKLGKRILEKEDELNQRLDSEGRAVDVIQRYKKADASIAGCRGCGSPRLLGWLADEIRRLEPEEQQVVREIVDN